MLEAVISPQRAETGQRSFSFYLVFGGLCSVFATTDTADRLIEIGSCDPSTTARTLAAQYPLHLREKDAQDPTCQRRAAESDVIAAAVAGVKPVEHELLGAEAREAGLLVEDLGVAHEFVLAAGGVGVDLDYAGVGSTARRSRAGERFRGTFRSPPVGESEARGLGQGDEVRGRGLVSRPPDQGVRAASLAAAERSGRSASGSGWCV